MEQKFLESSALFDDLRKPLVENQHQRDGFELLIKFDEHTYHIWGQRQQALYGDVNVPKEGYMDTGELSWMWSWIRGNRKWHAWNNCKGLSQIDAKFLFIEEVRKLQEKLPKLIDGWRNELDPMKSSD
ncbi:acyl coA binding protein [Ditylenchus destructor]|nr:acyl coA binding protein [Ditylenchus destructor]